MNVFKVVTIAAGLAALGGAVVGAVKAYKKLGDARAETTEVKVESAPQTEAVVQEVEESPDQSDDKHQADIDAIESALADPQKLEQLALRFNRGYTNERKRKSSRRAADPGT